MTKLLAIVPAYNEGAAIAATVDDIRRHAPEFDVVVVDDGSTDDTSEVATSVGAQVVRHPFNLGIGGAVQSGYQYALDHDYDVAIQVDGDGQHDARHIADLLERPALPARPQHGHRLALPGRGRPRLPLLGLAADRHPALLVGAVRCLRAAGSPIPRPASA